MKIPRRTVIPIVLGVVAPLALVAYVMTGIGVNEFTLGAQFTQLASGEERVSKEERTAHLLVGQRHQAHGGHGRPATHVRDSRRVGEGRQGPATSDAPDFAEFLDETPEEQRTGPVFELVAPGGRPCRDKNRVGKMISKMGKAANVKVATSARGKVKHASAHNLWRAFGFRGAIRVSCLGC